MDIAKRVFWHYFPQISNVIQSVGLTASYCIFVLCFLHCPLFYFVLCSLIVFIHLSCHFLRTLKAALHPQHNRYPKNPSERVIDSKKPLLAH